MNKAKKVEIFGLFIAWWIGFLSHHLTFATTSHANLGQKNDFFDKNESSIVHIGIIGWGKYTKKNIQQHWAVGREIAIGPVVEWHPFNGIGLQIGLLYSHNSFYTVDFSLDRKKLSDPDLFSFGRRFINILSKALSHPYQGYTMHVALGNIQFHAISIPLFLRLYPEKSRRWICYGGPRLICLLPGIEKKQYCPVHVDTSVIKDILYDSLIEYRDLANEGELMFDAIPGIAQHGLSKLRSAILKIDPNNTRPQLLSNQQFHWDLVWNFGLEFRGRSGLVIGINGLGLVLGYDFIK
ncbi:hypothetical protein ACRRVB_02535 [Candidatus Cardinium hertigii]|uniref:hypothetical protein n=1 Tax=Candidatus Cardinium hertigii TaxID=247481 RepID=UPI003D7C373B